jgi:hypothetical protein
MVHGVIPKVVVHNDAFLTLSAANFVPQIRFTLSKSALSADIPFNLENRMETTSNRSHPNFIRSLNR